MADPKDAVLGLWRTLSARDWDRLGDWVTDDCIYVDMPVGPTAAARGPVDIVKRLQVGLRDLAGYENHDGLLVAEGDAVLYEHSETWTFASGEVVVLPFVSVHRVRDGRVALWKDYWDFGTVQNAAPPDWMENLLAADTSWMFDATGLV
ncbi:ketosteroid isomerase-like protein [Nocardioides thalensis]|uniref:Ketosteroid isomerase-like protein n=1 Tax=Nocardioides thalensis TaxID=1914755 RepID=A0A853C0P9_9ACTN|nr:ketosteroid isomerase-like protein [Nocardioides thalensis]